MFNSITVLPKKSQVAQVDLSGEPGVSSFTQVTDGKKIDLEMLLTEMLFKQILFVVIVTSLKAKAGKSIEPNCKSFCYNCS